VGKSLGSVAAPAETLGSAERFDEPPGRVDPHRSTLLWHCRSRMTGRPRARRHGALGRGTVGLAMRSPPPVFGDIFELLVTLRDIDPPIWRKLCVPAQAPLGVLHEALQTAFGWKNCHLHQFLAGDIRFGMSDVDDEMFSVDERAAPLGAIARAGSELVYEYDFGDSWEHSIVVERVTSRGDATLRCTGGERACPPEDCGGAHGYAHMLQVLANPRDEEHAEMKQWVPRGFDPEKFELAAVNKKLATLSKRLARRGGR